MFTNIFQSKKWKKQTPVHFFFVFEKDTMDQADNNLRRDYHSTYQYSNNCKSSKHKHGFTYWLLRFFRYSSRKLWRRHFIKPRTWRWKSSTFPLFRLQKTNTNKIQCRTSTILSFPFSLKISHLVGHTRIDFPATSLSKCYYYWWPRWTTEFVDTEDYSKKRAKRKSIRSFWFCTFGSGFKIVVHVWKDLNKRSTNPSKNNTIVGFSW